MERIAKQTPGVAKLRIFSMLIESMLIEQGNDLGRGTLKNRRREFFDLMLIRRIL